MMPARTTGLFSLSRQQLFVLGVLLLFVGLSIQYSLKAMQNRSAIVRWREQLQQLDDEDIYQRYVYPNPPIMAMMLKPLAELPPLAGSLLWFYLKVGMTLLSLRWVFRMVEEAGRPFPPWAKAVTLLLSLRPIMGDLSHGNVNLLILFLVVASLHAYTRGRDVLAGVVMALAIACKVTPALFVPYFVWKRAWGTLLGCAFGLGLFFWLIPGLYLGFDQNAQLLGSWVEQMVKPYVVDGVVTSEHNNQSLPGLLFRLLTHSPSFSTYVDNVYTPVAYHNVVTLDPQVVRWLVKGCMGLFVLAVVWTCRTPTMPRGGWRLAAEFSLVTLGMLLFSERTWKHHCVTLLLPFAVLCYYVAVYRPGPLRRGYLIGSLATVALLMASTSTSLLESMGGGAKIAQVYGAYVWGYLVLIAALLLVLAQATPAPAEQGTVAPDDAAEQPVLATLPAARRAG